VPHTVFIVEAEDASPSWEDGVWLTGRFEGHLEGRSSLLESFEDLPLEEALAWGRARAGRVLIRHGDEPDVHYSAGTEHPPGTPRWPPAALPPLVGRRHPSDRWRDRTDDDPPIPWRVELLLVPPADRRTLEELTANRDGWAVEGARIADAAGATFSAEPLDTFIADLMAAQRRAGGGEFGWASYGGINFVLELDVEAATLGRAHEAALARLALPPGWRAEPSPFPTA
jgi:hypothetical protein